MSGTGLEVFDKTLQTTNTWLDEIMRETGPDRRLARHVLSAVLHAVRDRVPLNLAIHLGAQLPLLVRGAYYDRWDPAREPERYRSLEDFLERVGDGLSNARPVNRALAITVVFSVLARHLSPGQLENVRDALPRDVRALWKWDELIVSL